MSARPVRVFRAPIRPSARLLALAAAAGAVAATGQAPLGFWWLALPAVYVLARLVAARASPGPAVWIGWCGGVGYFGGALFWIVEPFMVEPDVYGWMAPFALVLMAGGMALFWALAAGLSRLGASPGARAVGFGLGLAATDLFRSYVFTGFPWALIGHVWIGTPVMQAAAVAGPIGLSAVTGLAATLPLAGRSARSRGMLAAAVALALGALWLAGLQRLAAPDPVRDPAIRVRLIQPNASQALKWRDDMWRVFLDRQFAQTEAPSDAPLDLIVWPETAVPFLLDRTGALFEEMAAASSGVPLAFGIQRQDGTRYYNSLAFIDGTGRLTDVYDKHHLVPFGEYIPMGDLLAGFGLRAYAAQEGYGYSPGPGAEVIDLGRIGRVLPLICYEAVFPQDLRTGGTRADWILQVTNDGWFGNLAGPYQHLAQARLRAVEQGLPLLRSANTGVTAAIDARGRVTGSLPLNTEGVLDVSVAGALPPTPYAQLGDWPATILLVAAFCALALRRRPATH